MELLSVLVPLRNILCLLCWNFAASAVMHRCSSDEPDSIAAQSDKQETPAMLRIMGYT